MTLEFKQKWHDGCTIYQIYPRSFQDSDGDGIGDLNGIRQRLSYVASLGVDAIWISPFFPSPMKDFGYDVSEYRDVDPLFGTLEHFKALLEDAHALGLKVVIDQVWSHTSDQHPWFVESRSDGSNDRADWYVWADAKPDGTPPNNWLSVFGGPAWTWDSGRHQFYLHNFLTSQPDLNFHNPAVQDAMIDIARFWLDLGVDGFRFDVCNFYFHSLGLEDNPVRADGWQGPKPHDWQSHVYCRSQPENLMFLSRLRLLSDEYGDKLLLGEIGDDNGIERQIEYTAGEERLHMAYSFDLLTPDGSPERLRVILQKWIEAGDGTPVWAVGNHDVPRVATRWTGGQPVDQQMRMLAAFHACLPGPICIYQGEELGLEQVDIPFEELRDPEGIAMWPKNKGRDGCRTPMVWEENKRHAGFSDAESTWLRIGSTHSPRSVDQQNAVPASLLHLYRKLIEWRGRCAAIKSGKMKLLSTPSELLAWKLSSPEACIVCCFNFTAKRVEWEGSQKSDGSLQFKFCEGVSANKSATLDEYGWFVAELH